MPRSTARTHNINTISSNMHRAYQPITPANNKLLKKRWDITRYEMHRKKVAQASPVIDNRPPKTYMHLHLKLKQLQLEEEKLATVERDNRILLEKMSYIMRSRGQVDNRNIYQHKSLNKTKRQRELLRVTHENQAILKRLTAKEPIYNHIQWEEEWQINENYMDNIAKYPKDWYTEMVKKPNSSKSKTPELIDRGIPSQQRKIKLESIPRRSSLESIDKHQRKGSRESVKGEESQMKEEEENSVSQSSIGAADKTLEVKIKSAEELENEHDINNEYVNDEEVKDDQIKIEDSISEDNDKIKEVKDEEVKANEEIEKEATEELTE